MRIVNAFVDGRSLRVYGYMTRFMVKRVICGLGDGFFVTRGRASISGDLASGCSLLCYGEWVWGGRRGVVCYFLIGQRVVYYWGCPSEFYSIKVITCGVVFLWLAGLLHCGH